MTLRAFPTSVLNKPVQCAAPHLLSVVATPCVHLHVCAGIRHQITCLRSSPGSIYWGGFLTRLAESSSKLESTCADPSVVLLCWRARDVCALWVTTVCVCRGWVCGTRRGSGVCGRQLSGSVCVLARYMSLSRNLAILRRKPFSCIFITNFVVQSRSVNC